ncbi:hypothetical protein [Panacagrimonas sp.]
MTPDHAAQREQIARACDELIVALESSRRPVHAALAMLVRAIKEQCE